MEGMQNLKLAWKDGSLGCFSPTALKGNLHDTYFALPFLPYNSFTHILQIYFMLYLADVKADKFLLLHHSSKIWGTAAVSTKKIGNF